MSDISEQIMDTKILGVALLLMVGCSFASARWLPTRSQDDRLEKLREMLKDLLQAQMQDTYERTNLMYKRDLQRVFDEQPQERFRNLKPPEAI